MKAGLLGRKLGHSLSPQIHRLFGDYEYKLYEREPSEVKDFVRKEQLDFFNVTIPYKRDVYQLCDELSPLARKLGNVNFVMRRSDGTLYGDNTDAYGVEQLLKSVGADVKGKVCAILGAGGAAMTAKAVLENLGAAEAPFVRRGEEPSKNAYLIVNATPVGMFPDVCGTRIDCSKYSACEVVIDLVYNPSPTRLVREARECGKRAQDGMVMLIAQAARAFELANGGVPDGNLYLYGPPASGKSTLGRRLQAATGRELVDIDEQIVKEESVSIPEIFSAVGEQGFRTIERRVFTDVVKRKGLIVSLGGGTLLNPDSRADAERTGRIVCLSCPVELLERRLSGNSRPLAADRDRLKKLIASRASHYASFPVQISFR